MSAKLKCSKCGAEIDTLKFGWGKWGWLWSVAAVLAPLAIFYWVLSPMWWKGDYRKDLVVVQTDAKLSKGEVDVLGKVTNNGKHDWQSVEVMAELYTKEGQYLTGQAQRLPGSIRPGEERQFRISVLLLRSEAVIDSPKIVLKVIEASYSGF
jgi:hypothetical protein